MKGKKERRKGEEKGGEAGSKEDAGRCGEVRK
jgi:hypothetical protein